MPAVSGASVPAWTAADARAVTRLMLIVVALRVATAVLAFYGNVTFPLARPEQFTVFETTDHFWDTFARNDSGWYLGIASRGYRWVPNGRGNLAFFPAYPLLMRAAGRTFGGTQADYYFGGIVVSWLASLGGVALVYALARRFLDQERAWHAALLTYLFPFAFFFGVVYSEALFVLALAAALYRTGIPPVVAGRAGGRVADGDARQRRDGRTGAGRHRLARRGR